MSKFFKNNLQHPDFYIVSFIFKVELPTILFIHGGPGFNCGVLEYLIENEEIFSKLDCNIILYDQRGCGRTTRNNTTVSHRHNITDLNDIIIYLSEIHKVKISCLVGHSYGAKLLFDYYKNTMLNILRYLYLLLIL